MEKFKTKKNVLGIIMSVICISYFIVYFILILRTPFEMNERGVLDKIKQSIQMKNYAYPFYFCLIEISEIFKLIILGIWSAFFILKFKSIKIPVISSIIYEFYALFFTIFQISKKYVQFNLQYKISLTIIIFGLLAWIILLISNKKINKILFGCMAIPRVIALVIASILKIVQYVLYFLNYPLINVAASTIGSIIAVIATFILYILFVLYILKPELLYKKEVAETKTDAE